MKRSEINREIREAEEIFRRHHFSLPPFAFWNPEQLLRERIRCREILDCFLGWDITDFGHGNFRKEGLLLFTLRNGISDSALYPKPYAEKIMLVRENQWTLLHCHRHKTEDIINRSGGLLCFRLFASREGALPDEQLPVSFSQDGVWKEAAPGAEIVLEPGESITLRPGIFHAFYGKDSTGEILVGEVSSVNDDHTDNIYHGEQARFPEIEEDEPPYRLLVKDYETILSGNIGK